MVCGLIESKISRLDLPVDTVKVESSSCPAFSLFKSKSRASIRKVPAFLNPLATYDPLHVCSQTYRAHRSVVA